MIRCSVVWGNHRSLYLFGHMYCKKYHHYQKSWRHQAAPANQEAEPGVIWASHLCDYSRAQEKGIKWISETKDAFTVNQVGETKIQLADLNAWTWSMYSLRKHNIMWWANLFKPAGIVYKYLHTNLFMFLLTGLRPSTFPPHRFLVLHVCMSKRAVVCL